MDAEVIVVAPGRPAWWPRRSWRARVVVWWWWSRVEGVTGEVLEPGDAERGRPGSHAARGSFELTAGAVIVSSGGIGANLDLVRRSWPERLGRVPDRMLVGFRTMWTGGCSGSPRRRAAAEATA